ncbi:Zinc finger C2H2 superfamily [Sergentomyia squamirostris]
MPEIRLEFYSVKQRIFLVKHFYQSFGDLKLVKSDYEAFYGNSQIISEQIISELIGLFENTGSVLKANHLFSAKFEHHSLPEVQTPQNIDAPPNMTAKLKENNVVLNVRELFTSHIDPLDSHEAPHEILSFTKQEPEDTMSEYFENDNNWEFTDEASEEIHKEEVFDEKVVIPQKIKAIRVNEHLEETAIYTDDDEQMQYNEDLRVEVMEQCPKCEKTCRTLKGHKCFLLACTYCRMKFPRKDLEKHMRQKHGNKKVHSCEFCGKLFLRRDDLQSHRRIHTKEKPFVCRVEGCSERFHWRQALRRHEQTFHIRGSTEIFHCNICSATYRLREYLNNHMRRWHGNQSTEDGRDSSHQEEHYDPRPYVCRVEGCKKSFAWRQSLRRHINSHNRTRKSSDWPPVSDLDEHQGHDVDSIEEENPLAECGDCQKKYNSQEIHICDVVSCLYCQKKFPKDSLVQHITLRHKRLHSPNFEDLQTQNSGVEAQTQDRSPTTVYTCKVCGKTCSRKHDLKSHEKVHSTERPYICKVEGCEKSFAWQHSLRRHERIHEKNKARLQCNTKNIKSSNKIQEVNRKQRIQTSSSEQKIITTPPQSPTVYFNCNLCDKMFLSKKNLSFHRSLAHSESRESPRPKSPAAPCHVCGIVLPTYPALKKHIKGHLSSLQESF